LKNIICIYPETLFFLLPLEGGSCEKIGMNPLSPALSREGRGGFPDED
jgi:hypothetical protein